MKCHSGGASNWLALRSQRPCACGDVFYAELRRSQVSETPIAKIDIYRHLLIIPMDVHLNHAYKS